MVMTISSFTFRFYHSLPGSSASSRFLVLIGGDVNTAAVQMSQLLQDCCADGTLCTQPRAHQRDSAKPGDLCIVGGVQASTLTTTAPNHDPQHEPYGICWSSMPQRSSSIRPGKQQPAAPSSGYATERPREGHQTAERKVPGGARRHALEHATGLPRGAAT